MTTIVQLSDTHLTDDDDRPERALDATIAALIEAGVRADLVLLTGDLADAGSMTATVRVRDLAARLDAPLLALAGNHDRAEVVAEVFGPRDAMDVDGWRIATASTSVEGEIAGRVDPAAVADLLDQESDRPTLLALHHSPASASLHPWFVLERADALLDEVAARPWVRAIAAGHLHEAFRIERVGIPIVGAPSTLYAIRHLGERWEKAPGDLVGATIWTLDEAGAASRFVARPPLPDA